VTARAEARREAELAAALAAVRGRLAASAVSSGRSARDVTLVVITKNWPASDVRHLARLGVTDVGENRDKEAREKAQDCNDLSLTWHFVGQLQSNKARSVATYADTVHSVDRARLVAALDSAAASAGRTLGCLVQVSLDGDSGRGGVLPGELPQLADQVATAASLDLRGLMAVAPLGADPDVAFGQLARLSERLLRDHPGAGWISAGMSGDLEAAIRAGATHVRVGSAILGERPRLR
jgi:PLP dependent protein